MSIDAPTQPAARTSVATSLVPWERVERFVGQLSHDLRNGLNACELQLTFLAEISTDPDAVEEVKGLRSTLAGITKQLQAIRVATGPMKAHCLEYPVADLFEDLQERFLRLHPAEATRVEWKSTESGGASVNIDPDLTLNAVLELLSNALHFAEAGTPIRCELREKGGEFVCRVEEVLGTPASSPADWGQQPLESSRRGAYGLGLFRARRGLEAQGSRLDFRHQPEEKSLVATVTLPGASANA